MEPRRSARIAAGAAPAAAPMSPAANRYGSDLMVDLLVQNEIEHVALNPGASFRGLHDSLVQRSDAPEMLLCTHEKVAVNVAHG